ncbi:hypothetical protein vseg_010695 [Gypsophila vaccaria]
MMFPFSLRDKAKKWLNTLNRTARGITDRETLVAAFYEEYFSAEKTALLRSQINGFRQMADETLYEAWEKYNALLNACPHHWLDDSFLYTQFYHSLNPDSKQILDSASSNGIFGNIEADQGRDTIDRMARQTHVNQSSRSMVRGKHHVDSAALLGANMTAQINELNLKLDSLMHATSSSATPQWVSAVSTSYVNATCENCDTFGHLAQYCSSPVEQVNAFQSYRQNPYSNFYNEGMRNHPNLSY